VKKLRNKILDFYLKFPLFSDGVLVFILYFLHNKVSFFHFTLTDKNNQLNILSNLIGTSVSLSGFILAALTIIVTFKSNIKAKMIEESANPLEMIFSSIHYPNIVRAFRIAISEFSACFILLYIFWASSDNISIHNINLIVCSGILIISMTILRSLLVLFKILVMENIK
jgi:hypothetical protein